MWARWAGPSPLWYSSYTNFTSQSIPMYKLKSSPTFFLSLNILLHFHPSSHCGSNMGQEQTAGLNQWIFVLWSADMNFFQFMTGAQWRSGSYTSTQKPFYESEAKPPQLISNYDHFKLCKSSRLYGVRRLFLSVPVRECFSHSYSMLD